MLTSWLSTEVGLGLLRNVLMGAGASLVTQGVLTQGGLSDVVGALIVIAGVVVSAIANRNKAKANAVVAAVEAHPGLKLVPASATATGKPAIAIRPAAISDMPPPSLTSSQ